MNVLKLNDRPKPVEDSAYPGHTPEELEEKIIEGLRTIYDPEIPVNIYELGLVYGIKIDLKGNVVVSMTLTSPGCPVAGSLPPEVEANVLSVPGVTSARVDLVWSPQWNPSMMSDAAKLQLGLY
jgi:FeS assembly SUF system protein